LRCRFGDPDLTGATARTSFSRCAGGSPKQGLAGHQTLLQALRCGAVGGKIVGVSWFGGPFRSNVDLVPRAQRALPVSGYQHAKPT